MGSILPSVARPCLEVVNLPGITLDKSLRQQQCKPVPHRLSSHRMALTELSHGHIGRNGRAINTPPNSEASETGKPAAIRMPTYHTPPMPTPTSIQSMLKNGTEIGNVGELALNSNWGPSPGQRWPSPRSSSSVLPLARRDIGHFPTKANPRTYEHHTSSGHLQSYHPGRISGHPNAAFLHRNRSQTSSTTSRAPSKFANSGSGKSYAMMHSSLTSRSTPRHPAHINGYLWSQGDPRDSRPRSPLAYPNKVKRPGYRPYSPALTEIHRSGSR